MSKSPLLSVKNLSKYYGRGHTEVRAVDDVSFDVSLGEIVLIMGPSGSGKTTLLSMIGGLLRPSSGQIVVDGIDITSMDESGLPNVRASKIGFVFQAFNLLDALTVEENILFPGQLIEAGMEEVARRADHLVEYLGLAARRKALPRTLSGGEKQRVALARALINKPQLILADEPTGNLDSKSGQDVLMILHDIARDEGRSVVVVTHDPRVEDVADRILWLEDGALRDRRPEEHDWTRDPVCGMRVDKRAASQFSEYAGQRYAFCSRRCFERFAEDPSRYAEGASVVKKP